MSKHTEESDQKVYKEKVNDLEILKKNEKVLNICIFIGFILFLIFAASRFYRFYGFKVETMKSNTWNGEKP